MSPLCCDKDTPKILSWHKPPCCWQSLSSCAPASHRNGRAWSYFGSVRGREVTLFTLRHHQPSLPLSLSPLNNVGQWKWSYLNTACPLWGLKNPTSLPSHSFDCHWGFCLPANTFLPVCTKFDILAKQLFCFLMKEGIGHCNSFLSWVVQVNYKLEFSMNNTDIL